ncbi:allantoin permease, putative [Talaromyces stipitatus ATCC 10500]|uniref:Allantoin permease, putative n=1 Tax=Talaromyces stipitatus (strain ATCC 10500 / CBS 375.48 / QM 6759 / NRRL 1006) TaxID=441959 RepID=B8M4B3_TALSN|nr:allantoin permease, putative [Talaromyces stipitatus ATCC 10500]EED19108.1 allantoin permease, putative [Talaromyces stipitatus ATCC 10500]
MASSRKPFSYRTQHFLDKLKVKNNSGEENGQFGKWSNKDLDPSPPSQRTWSAWSFFAFQFSIAFSPTTYNAGASLYAIGLNWWTIFIASVIVSIMIATLLFLNARGPARYHIGYPTLVRASSGIYGSLVFVFIRGVVAILYMSIQTYYASQFLAVMLRCVFGHRWTDFPNHLPASAAITSANLLAFGLLWLIQFPFAFVHPSKMARVFQIKSVIAPIGLIVTMIWALASSHGADFNGLSHKTVSGAALGWSFMKAINSIVSNVIPPLVNIADLARYVQKPRDTLPMPIGLVVSKPLVVFLGMIITAAGYKQFGHAYWNLWDFYSSVLDHYWSPGARTLVFLAAGIQAFATFVTNFTSNSIPVGCDLTGLFPRHFTIVRGQVLCFLLAWICVPWKLTHSATSFLNFLGSYLCFICPIVACMVVDYWVIRKGNLHIPSLYKTQPGSIYYYTYGFNLRAFIAWIVAIALVIPGVAGVLSPGSIGNAAIKIYNMGFLLSTTFAGLVYYVACRICPVEIYPAEFHPETRDRSWEAMGYTEGFCPEDEVIPEYLREKVLDGTSRIHVATKEVMSAQGDRVSQNSAQWA